MSYDPNLPLEGTEIDAAQMRSQLQGLKALIDAQAELISQQSAILTSLSTQQTDTASQLAAAQAQISTLSGEMTQTARNPAGVSPFNSIFSDPMTSGDGNTIQSNLNTLLAAVQRM